jgi:hypothetical protein
MIIIPLSTMHGAIFHIVQPISANATMYWLGTDLEGWLDIPSFLRFGMVY